MNIEAVATKLENAVIAKFWLRLVLALFVAAPLLIFLMWWEPPRVFVAWVFAAELYAVAWLVQFFSRAFGERRALVFARTTLALLSPVIWGGVFATIYILFYTVLMLFLYGFPK